MMGDRDERGGKKTCKFDSSSMRRLAQNTTLLEAKPKWTAVGVDELSAQITGLTQIAHDAVLFELCFDLKFGKLPFYEDFRCWKHRRATAKTLAKTDRSCRKAAAQQ